MSIIYDIVDPVVLTEVVRESPEPAKVGLNAILPDRLFPSIEAVWDVVTQTNQAANFQSFDAETAIGERDSASRKSAEMLKVGEKYRLGEYDTLRLQGLRTGGNMTPLMQDVVFNDALKGARAARIRAEYARGDVLTDAILTITDGGLDLSYDFGLDTDNDDTAAASWHTTTTDIPTDIGNFLDAAENLDYAGYMWVSRKTARSLAANTKYQGLASVGGVTPSRLSLGDINGIHDRLGFPEVMVYDSSFKIAGSTTRVLGEDLVLFTPRDPSELGFTAWGVTAEALELIDANVLTVEGAAGLTAAVTSTFDPPTRWTKVTGICLPVLTDPNRLGIFDCTP